MRFTVHPTLGAQAYLTVTAPDDAESLQALVTRWHDMGVAQEGQRAPTARDPDRAALAVEIYQRAVRDYRLLGDGRGGIETPSHAVYLGTADKARQVIPVQGLRLLLNGVQLADDALGTVFEQWLSFQDHRALSGRLYRPLHPVPYFEDPALGVGLVSNTFRPPYYALAYEAVREAAEALEEIPAPTPEQQAELAAMDAHLADARGDTSVFDDYLSTLIPEPVALAYFRSWLGYKLENPTAVLPAVLFIAAGRFGTGRGTLFQFLGALFGPQNVISRLSSSVLDPDSPKARWNAWQAECLVGFIPEMKAAKATARGDADAADRVAAIFRELVEPGEGELAEIERKGADAASEPMIASLIAASNDSVPLRVPMGDRRLMAVDNAPTSPVQQAALRAAAKEPMVLLRVALRLRAEAFPDAATAAAAPPATDALRRLVRGGEGSVDAYVEEALTDPTLLPNPVFTTAQLIAAVNLLRWADGLPPVGDSHLANQVAALFRRRTYPKDYGKRVRRVRPFADATAGPDPRGLKSVRVRVGFLPVDGYQALIREARGKPMGTPSRDRIDEMLDENDLTLSRHTTRDGTPAQHIKDALDAGTSPREK